MHCADAMPGKHERSDRPPSSSEPLPVTTAQCHLDLVSSTSAPLRRPGRLASRARAPSAASSAAQGAGRLRVIGTSWWIWCGGRRWDVLPDDAAGAPPCWRRCRTADRWSVPRAPCGAASATSGAGTGGPHTPQANPPGGKDGVRQTQRCVTTRRGAL